MSTSRQRCGSWLAWAVALAAGCGDGGKGGEAKGGDDADAGADTAAVDCAARPLDCDGEDNDCDGVTDEGGEEEQRSLTGFDADSDGWAAGEVNLACPGALGPSGALLGGGDCDDADPAVHPGAAERCLIRGDDDCDGAADCGDGDCAGRACAEDCDNGSDDDNDRRTDCLDTDCATDPGCVEDCGNGADDDDDGRVDCLDTDCATDPRCVEDCGNRLDDDDDRDVDCEDADCATDPRCVEDCADGVDDDGDGLADCDDPDCFSAACPELCDDGLDNDGDGGADCSDAECLIFGCAEVCTDRIDNDLDGLDNCADPDCFGSACREQCGDAPRADEDGDGLANCEDADCASRCVERCDTEDRDDDGLVGCDDPDCTFTLHCWQGLTVEAEGLQLRRTVRIDASVHGAPRVQRSVELTADHFRVSGTVPTTSGGSTPCWFEATDLTLTGRRTDALRSGTATWSFREAGHAAAESDGPPPCPEVRLNDLGGLVPDGALSPWDTWSMSPGLRSPIFWVDTAGPAPRTQLELIILSVTPYTIGGAGTASWMRTASQSAWGELGFTSP